MKQGCFAFLWRKPREIPRGERGRESWGLYGLLLGLGERGPGETGSAGWVWLGEGLGGRGQVGEDHVKEGQVGEGQVGGITGRGQGTRPLPYGRGPGGQGQGGEDQVGESQVGGAQWHRQRGPWTSPFRALDQGHTLEVKRNGGGPRLNLLTGPQNHHLILPLPDQGLQRKVCI